MQIFNEQFLKLLEERGAKYIKALREFDRNMENIFDEPIEIDGITFESSLNKDYGLDILYGSIEIHYLKEEEIRCSHGQVGWIEEKMTFPAWILSDKFEEKLKETIQKKKENERNQKEAIRRNEISQMLVYATRYGYDIKEIK